MGRFFLALFLFHSSFSSAATEWLVRSTPGSASGTCAEALPLKSPPEKLEFGDWKLIRLSQDWDVARIRQRCGKLFITNDWEPNQRFSPLQIKPERSPAQEGKEGEDPYLKDQWSLSDAKALGLPLVKGALVAVIDTGVDYNHPELQSSLWKNPGETGLDSNGRSKESNGIDDDGNGYIDDVIGWDFVDNDNLPFDQVNWSNEGHGTHLAGVIAAQAHNSRGIKGLSPGTPLMIVRFIDANGYGTTAAAIRSLHYAIRQGARILNISWGGDEEAVANSKALREAFLEAQREGLLVVVAAGTGSVDLDRAPGRSVPVSYRLDNMISVAASGPGGHRATFSNFGLKTVDLAAPGVGVLSTVPGGGIDFFDGSSVAAPHVAAALSLAWGAAPHLEARQLKKYLLEAVTPTPSLKNRVMTEGRLNVEELLRTAAPAQ